MKRLRTICLTVTVCLLGAVVVGNTSPVQAEVAGPVEAPTLTARVLTAPETSEFNPAIPLTEYEYNVHSGRYKLKNKKSYLGVFGNTTDIVIEAIEFDPDPVMTGNYLITNNTGSTQTYSINFTQATVFGGPNTISGAIAVEIMDGASDGATLAAPVGGSVYSASIDGTVVQTMMDDVFSVVAASGSTNTSEASFGPSANALAVSSNMDIDLTFTLTAGDSAAILSRFEIVPEPGTMALLGLGIGGLALRRRRKN